MGLDSEDVCRIDGCWRAASYLSVGQIYLLDNQLLREPLRPEHVKPRLLGLSSTGPQLLLRLLNRLNCGAAPGHDLRGAAGSWLPCGGERGAGGHVQRGVSTRRAPPRTSSSTRCVARGCCRWSYTCRRGLDTFVGEHGSRLSGGERQRLNLARALLADFPVLVPDEPTEHLEEPTATAITDDRSP
ncbi:MAG: ATP-binding cassette domain-containing protein [Streptosporangiales bacterium]|nr:ATP-binding cassette domain-containing protein [Streptosporangiales bacterium]